MRGSLDDGHGGSRMTARFMEVDGLVGEIPGADEGIHYVSRDLGSKSSDSDTLNMDEMVQSGNNFKGDTIIVDSKRKPIDKVTNLEESGHVIQLVKDAKNGPKKELKAGPILQAHIDK